MYKKLLIVVACFISSFLHGSSNTLVVGTNVEFPPFSYIQNGVIVGFDVDIAKEVALKIGKEIKFKDMPFDALIPSILLGQVDFVAAGMSFTEERAKRVSFTKSYLTEDPLVIFTSAKHNLGLEDLKGKNIVVIEGFTADLFMSSKKGINLIRLPTQADGFMAVKNGRADAFVTSKSTVDSFFEIQDASQFNTTIIDGTGETCALVVPKNKPQMLADVQQALNDLEKDGTMAKLKATWKLK